MTRLIEAIEETAEEIERRNERRRKQAALAALLLLRRKKLLQVLDVAAFAGIDRLGKLIWPVPVRPGDELYVARMYSPRAGTISRDPTGQPFAIARGVIDAGKVATIKTELLMKRWVHGARCKTGPCEDCAGNAEQGWIPSNELFPSGVESPSQHPRCDCYLETRRATV